MGLCLYMSPPAISTVFSFHRILGSISMRSISNFKSPYFDKINQNTLSETLMQSLWNWTLLLCCCLCANITHVLKASFWGLLGLTPGNLVFWELKFFKTYFLESKYLRGTILQKRVTIAKPFGMPTILFR